MSVVVRLMLPPLKAIKIDRGPRLPKYLRAIPRKGSRLKQAFRKDGPGFGKASFRSGQTERRFSVDGEELKTERPIRNPKRDLRGNLYRSASISLLEDYGAQTKTQLEKR